MESESSYFQVITEDNEQRSVDEYYPQKKNQEEGNSSTSNFNATHQTEAPGESDATLKDMYTSLKKDALDKKLIKVNDFIIENVFPPCNEMDDLNKAIADLTVRIAVKFSNTIRSRSILLSKTEEKNPFDGNTERAYWRTGTGRVVSVSPYEENYEIRSCRCQECQHSEKPSREWGSVTILTASHVVFEESAADCIFGDESQDDPPVKLTSVSIRKSNLNDGWSELECVTCDLDLLDKFGRMTKNCSQLWKKLNQKCQQNRDDNCEIDRKLKEEDNQIFAKIYDDQTCQLKVFFLNIFTIERFPFVVSSASLIIAVISIATVCIKIRNAEFRSDDVFSASDKICLSCTHSSLFGKLEEINKLLEEITRATQDKLENSVQPQITKSHTPSSAHIHLQSPPKMPGTEGDNEPNFSNKDHIEAKLQVPSDDSGASQHARGIHVGDNGIHILYSGLYYIYSKVDFKTNTTKPSSEFAYQTWFHYVHRISPNSPMNSGVLLRTVFTACPFCNRIDESGFTGGIFHLQAGDKIQVCFSGQGFIDYEPNTSFLGLFMLVSPQDHHLDVGV